MFKTTFLFLLLVISSADLLCQTLTGVVYDENKKAIPGASVYLNGTTIGTMTDKNGRYKITTDNIMNSRLIISFLGYQSAVIDDPFDIKDSQIYLVPKLFQLPEIVVNSNRSRFARKEYLKIFKQEFLGSSRAGRSCKIKNEEDIIFKYDEKTYTLKASSNKPIIIDNPYLGYLVSFDPIDCHIIIESTGFFGSFITGDFQFLGTIFFTDTVKNKNNKEISRRRKNAYDGSKMHFFRNFYNGIWNPKEFLLYKDATADIPIKTKENFILIDSSGIRKIFIIVPDSSIYVKKPVTELVKKSVTEDSVINVEHDLMTYITNNEYFHKTFNILYKGWASTNIIFKTKVLFIDKYGEYGKLDLIGFTGAMTEKRIGDLLPVDYKTEKQD